MVILDNSGLMVNCSLPAITAERGLVGVLHVGRLGDVY
jgi:hypothetical protein